MSGNTIACTPRFSISAVRWRAATGSSWKMGSRVASGRLLGFLTNPPSDMVCMNAFTSAGW